MALAQLRKIYAWARERALLPEIPEVDDLPRPQVTIGGVRYLCMSSNNYLGLAHDPRICHAALEGVHRYGIGTCESRNMAGNLELYNRLEHELAELKHKPASVLFPTGYAANLGALSAFTRAALIARGYGYVPPDARGVTFFSDELNHISIAEGMQLAGGKVVRYRHGDANDLERKLQRDGGRKVIVTDGVFSQDGDVAPLPHLVALADQHDAVVYVDDAHATGILGPQGRGTLEHFGCTGNRIVVMGTLSKAIGAIGGVVATDADVCAVIKLSAAMYGFTSTIPPEQACGILEALRIIREEPALRERLWANQRYFVEGLERIGLEVVSRQTPIVPVLAGDEKRCEQLFRGLLEAQILTTAVKFPAVARGKARIRCIVNATHTREQLDAVLSAFERVGRAQGLVS